MFDVIDFFRSSFVNEMNNFYDREFLLLIYIRVIKIIFSFAFEYYDKCD